MDKTKVFNGKTYTFVASALTKKNAEKRADQIRESGHNARVIKSVGTGKKKYYLVYRN